MSSPNKRSCFHTAKGAADNKYYLEQGALQAKNAVRMLLRTFKYWSMFSFLMCLQYPEKSGVSGGVAGSTAFMTAMKEYALLCSAVLSLTDDQE